LRMPKKQRASINGQSEWETTHSGGFSPMWKPQEEGEFVIIYPVGIREITVKSGKQSKENFLMDARILEAQGTFGSGSGNNAKSVDVSNGDMISIPLSYNLLGDIALSVQENEGVHPEMSRLSKYSIDNKIPIRVQFNGIVKLAGGRKVKLFEVQAPKGVKESILAG